MKYSIDELNKLIKLPNNEIINGAYTKDNHYKPIDYPTILRTTPLTKDEKQMIKKSLKEIKQIFLKYKHLFTKDKNKIKFN